MKLMSMGKQIEELEKRIKALEARPVYIPQPYYVPYYIPPVVPYYPQPYPSYPWYQVRL